MADSVHAWTEGLPHLVTLAASWLKSAGPDEVGEGIEALSQQQEVQDFLLAAISDLLDSADRAILDAASVFRDRFTDESLAFVADQTVGTVQDTSRRLVRRHLASRSRTGDVAFFHASVREYFYARLTPERRRAIHLRAAEWYAAEGNRGEAAYHARLARS
jgi:ATP/maltotriose-dependent transcriptional regulator MalT